MFSWLQDGGGSCLLSPGDCAWTSTGWQYTVRLSKTVWARMSHRASCQVCSPTKAVGAGSEAAVRSEGCLELSLSQHSWPGMLCLWAGAAVSRGCHPGPECFVAGRQTNAEQMFNYQHSVLRSLEISASKCRYFTRA